MPPDSPSLADRLSQADRLLQQGRPDQAEAMFLAILAERADQVEALGRLGVIRFQQGRTAEAERLLTAATKAAPGDAAVFSTLGFVQAAGGRHAEALHSYDRALSLQPRFVQALYRRGKSLAALGRPGEALADFDRVLALDPRDVLAVFNRGLILRALARPSDALAAFERAAALKPDFAEALFHRALALEGMGRPLDALASYDAALAREPGLVEALNNRGAILLDLGRPEAALASLNAALIQRPDYLDALNNRGGALRQLRQYEAALADFERVLAREPRNAAALNNRGNVLRDLGRWTLALASYDAALAVDPRHLEALTNRGGALRRLGRAQEAMASFEQALSIDPQHAEAICDRGVLLAELGQAQDGAREIERAIALRPGRASYYYSLSEACRIGADEPVLRAMRGLARDMGELSTTEQIDLHFALGKALTDIGDPDGAFGHLRQGNDLMRRRVAYDEAATLASLEAMAQAFSAEALTMRSAGGDPSTAPVFIVGMPRSGTTLVEQVLASHPAVFAAGESHALAETIEALGGPALIGAPDALARLPDEALRALGAAYVRAISDQAEGALRIVNKMPDNFRFIGLICLALPKARIIHTRRDPIDTCLSCYSKRFTGHLPFTFDLGELGRYHRGYQALMAHWRGVIPSNMMLEVDYEAMTGDLEAQARRIIAHCGLDWDPRCLDFHLTDRHVRTASAVQVRQPLYQSAVGRWRAFEPHLGPLIAALGPAARG